MVNTQSSVACPLCKYGVTKAVATWTGKGELGKEFFPHCRRRRVCLKCEHKFYTYEVSQEVFNQARARVKKRRQMASS